MDCCCCSGCSALSCGAATAFAIPPVRATGWTLSSLPLDVSLDCERIGCGVRFILLMFDFRLGDADFFTSSISGLWHTGGFLVLPWSGSSEGGVNIHSSDSVEKEKSVSKFVGLGAGHQPGVGTSSLSRVMPHLHYRNKGCDGH